MKCKGRVPTILPTSRAFTFALPVRLTSKALGPIMNVEKNEMDNARKQRQER